ncbi:MAG TPA: FAD-binding oxidoreductase [Rhizomicrobium sp.]|jgi:FAD/FMN-containing dehydrogenase|nr:FAD-binding oxidoreductase [Rhizomicrobium sp.]
MIFTRRHFTAALIAAPAILRGARAAALPKLPNIAPEDASFVAPGNALYDSTLPSYNLRTELRPALRVLTKTPRGVQQTLDWLRTTNTPFALRSGGHCYEGFSQSTSVIVDTRLMNAIALDAHTGTLSVGAGTTLGQIYKFVAPRGLAFPGGSCPTVGITGHTMGGGFGLIARGRGLACDALTGIDLVNANAQLVHADAATNSDLFWASRGGGGGTFGAATALQFHVQPIGLIVVYAVTWTLGIKQAAALFKAWQDWAPNAPDTITGIFKLSRRSDGRMTLHAAGQSTGSLTQLRRELRALTDTAEPSSGPTFSTMSFLSAVNHFAGGWGYETQISKAKSDYITRKLDAAGIDALIGGIAALPANEVIAICDAYGGAPARIADDATAFAYRAGTQFCIQYYTSWAGAAAGTRRLADIRALYTAMRPYSGGAYVNYCDLDLADWQQAYWRQNLPRLKAIKAKADPAGFFHHAQSVR